MENLVFYNKNFEKLFEIKNIEKFEEIDENGNIHKYFVKYKYNFELKNGKNIEFFGLKFKEKNGKIEINEIENFIIK